MEIRLRYVRLFALALVALLLLAPAAQAQEVTIYAGALFPGMPTINDVKSNLDRSPIYGLRVTTGFAASLKLEHTFAFSNDFLYPGKELGVTSAKGVMLNSNLLVNIPLGHVIPYVTAGLGFIHQWGSDNLPIGTKFAVNYGGGIKLRRLAGPIGIRVDARGYTATKVFSSKLSMFELSGGLLLSF